MFYSDRMLTFLIPWQRTEESGLGWGTEFLNEKGRERIKKQTKRTIMFLSHFDWPFEQSTSLTLFLVK